MIQKWLAGKEPDAEHLLPTIVFGRLAYRRGPWNLTFNDEQSSLLHDACGKARSIQGYSLVVPMKCPRSLLDS